MPIRYSSVVGGSGGTGFNLDVGSSGNTTFYFDSPQPAGGYSITSQLTDASIEFYAIAEDGTLAGYTNTKALSATKDFDTLVVYGAATNDLITFEYKSTTLPTASGDQESGAGPYIDSLSTTDFPTLNDTTIVTGGNFATDVTVTFTGNDDVVRNAKSIVRTSSTQLIVTRPDDMLEDASPYVMTVANPGIPQPAYKSVTASVTAGQDPTWSTPSGQLANAEVGVAFTFNLSATDESAIAYSLTSGSLPSGLSLSSTGQISGTPTQEESQTFEVTATDQEGNFSSRSFVLSAVTFVATGGTINDANGYRTHTFKSSGTFSINLDRNIEYLVVAGGGGGGVDRGGGGGAGGYRSSVSGDLSGENSASESALLLTSGSHTVTVGAGGARSTAWTSRGSNGVDSSISSISSTGGGGGGSGAGDVYSGLSGGSGGGGFLTGSGGAGSSGQGFSGGAGIGGLAKAAGGGGASEAGFSPSGNGGDGGDGLASSIIPSSLATSIGVGQVVSTSVYFAGGGGGGTNSGGSGGIGGLGGGANGGLGDNSTTAPSAASNTGGGGGGGTGGGGPAGGNGGSGIVIVRYAL